MKKFILIFSTLFLLVGCDQGTDSSTPSALNVMTSENHQQDSLIQALEGVWEYSSGGGVPMRVTIVGNEISITDSADGGVFVEGAYELLDEEVDDLGTPDQELDGLFLKVNDRETWQIISYSPDEMIMDYFGNKPYQYTWIKIADHSTDLKPEQSSGQYPQNLTQLTENEIPDDIELKGELLSAKSWEDANGQNIIVVTLLGPEYSLDDNEEVLSNAEIFAAQYLKETDQYKQIWDIYDVSEDCRFDFWMGLVNEPFITDLNRDGTTESTLIYRMACRSDISPSDMKVVMMHPGDKKMILRGRTALEGRRYAIEQDSFEPNLDRIGVNELGHSLHSYGRYKQEGFYESSVFYEFARSKWLEFVLQDQFNQFYKPEKLESDLTNQSQNRDLKMLDVGGYASCFQAEIQDGQGNKIETNQEIEEVLDCHSGSTVLSPNSQYLLYGKTDPTNDYHDLKLYDFDDLSTQKLMSFNEGLDGLGCLWKEDSKAIACVWPLTNRSIQLPQKFLF